MFLEFCFVHLFGGLRQSWLKCYLKTTQADVCRITVDFGVRLLFQWGNVDHHQRSLRIPPDFVYIWDTEAVWRALWEWFHLLQPIMTHTKTQIYQCNLYRLVDIFPKVGYWICVKICVYILEVKSKIAELHIDQCENTCNQKINKNVLNGEIPNMLLVAILFDFRGRLNEQSTQTCYVEKINWFQNNCLNIKMNWKWFGFLDFVKPRKLIAKETCIVLTQSGGLNGGKNYSGYQNGLFNPYTWTNKHYQSL